MGQHGANKTRWGALRWSVAIYILGWPADETLKADLMVICRRSAGQSKTITSACGRRGLWVFGNRSFSAWSKQMTIVGHSLCFSTVFVKALMPFCWFPIQKLASYLRTFINHNQLHVDDHWSINAYCFLTFGFDCGLFFTSNNVHGCVYHRGLISKLWAFQTIPPCWIITR